MYNVRVRVTSRYNISYLPDKQHGSLLVYYLMYERRFGNNKILKTANASRHNYIHYP